ncbi:SigE family RNA polymerase sigma factor [Dermatobacter hominis]|uniref:SigE family RNA polymerase sigma factor n=1 Tax=Dermatobacter hominis TaxID=2884263 RepID=UPI001D120B7F|nr:SigE family RNA polymerase sigma factor [Dermatobacter hominis]UDY34045.1 RNA polymerase sigma factor [Dermatobacter hominis]
MPVRDEEFRAFYERMHDRALRTARRLIGNEAVAEDLSAEALARAYARWGQVRSHPNPDAWLLRVVGNLAIDHVRRERRTGPEPRTEHVASDRPDDDAVLRVDLARAVHKLSNRQQEVVVMRYLVDLSEDQVATSLGMSTGSVKTHLSRASGRLRDHMAELDEIAARAD